MKNNNLKAFSEFKQSIYSALETYSNVHRGSGHKSVATTYLYEKARDIVMEYTGLEKHKYVVIFCSPLRAEMLSSQLKHDNYRLLSGSDTGLPLGIRALVVERKSLPRGIPFQTGGGTARLVAPGWVVWAKAPEKFEAGTPAIINTVAFARALQLTRYYGQDVIRDLNPGSLSAIDILYHDDLDQYSGKRLLDELCRQMIGRDLPVPTLEGKKPYVNLDNAASTPSFVPVWNTFCQALIQPRQIQDEIINEVKNECLKILNAPPSDYEVIFTSNTTESVNLVADSLGQESEPDSESVVLNTLIEHNSNDLPWRNIPHFSLVRMQADDDGFINTEELETILCNYNKEERHGKKRIRLVAISGASNVLGVFNNLEEISRISHRYGVRLLVDAAQLIAHRKTDLEKIQIDFLVFSAHKIYAPFGCGVLVIKKGSLHFSHQYLEQIKASGEENAAGIAALGKSLILLQRIGMDLIQEEEQELTAKVLRGLSKIGGLTIYGIKDPGSVGFARKGGVVVFNLKNTFANNIATELAEQDGIGIRYGCHCAHILIKHLVSVGPFLERFQRIIATLFPVVNFPGLARISLGIGNNEKDIERLIRVLDKIVRKYKQPKSDIHKQMSDFTMAVSAKVYSGPEK